MDYYCQGIEEDPVKTPRSNHVAPNNGDGTGAQNSRPMLTPKVWR